MKDSIARLSLIGLAGAVGLAATFALGQGSGFQPLSIRSDDGGPYQNRLYGRVVTVSGEELRGFIRWDRNEGSWADLLDAYKQLPRTEYERQAVEVDEGSSGFRIRSSDGGRISVLGLRFAFEGFRDRRVTSGIRFGHVRRVEVLDDDAALFILKSGEEIELSAHSTDLGDGMRALIVEDALRGPTELRWRDLDVIEFMPAGDAEGMEPEGRRLYGTLTARSGDQFTGYVGWDVDEIYTSDILDGEEDGQDREIPFGRIASIERHSSSAARVLLKDGQELTLRDSNDVDSGNRGIAISDPALGQVSLEWDEFESVVFHEAEDHASYSEFPGGERIRGIVVTDRGEEYQGLIRWDADEAYTWELLNGENRGVEYAVEFDKIARIAKASSRSVEVELLDGRTFRLRDSNDVDDGNRGIFIEDGESGVTFVDWESFAELRLER
jgi:hypothetical protein